VKDLYRWIRPQNIGEFSIKLFYLLQVGEGKETGGIMFAVRAI
jgi:hypothetical protein